jgi:hypothetical protein
MIRGKTGVADINSPYFHPVPEERRDECIILFSLSDTEIWRSSHLTTLDLCEGTRADAKGTRAYTT